MLLSGLVCVAEFLQGLRSNVSGVSWSSRGGNSGHGGNLEKDGSMVRDKHVNDLKVDWAEAIGDY